MLIIYFDVHLLPKVDIDQWGILLERLDGATILDFSRIGAYDNGLFVVAHQQLRLKVGSRRGCQAVPIHLNKRHALVQNGKSSQ